MEFKCIKTPAEFKKSKEEVLTKLMDFRDTYSEFIKTVKPSEWRRTGNHFAELKKMQLEIPIEEGPITIKDLENDFIRNQLLNDEEKELWDNAKKYNL